ncbi:dephospho-CoA kinase [Actinocorallia populi]|uniref:dephospho-CoA kinase n=1 Tax=Actinocorallia populi TaxID=2079200 RepID=UPI001E4026B9|nr:dephospho-CoA kinase [Actinocorallia populi]
MSRLRVGLTGGIGSGKSEVSRRLAAAGAVLIDSDALAREVVEPGTEGLARIVEEFGADILTAEGTLNREKLGSIVFSDPEKLARLNAITHPLIGARSAELQDAAPEDAVLLFDVPLLAENALKPLYDLVVVVDAPVETQLARLTDLRGMSEQEARKRIAAQATREQRLAIADRVIDNSGTLAGLAAQVEELWEDLQKQRS